MPARTMGIGMVVTMLVGLAGAASAKVVARFPDGFLWFEHALFAMVANRALAPYSKL